MKVIISNTDSKESLETLLNNVKHDAIIDVHYNIKYGIRTLETDRLVENYVDPCDTESFAFLTRERPRIIYAIPFNAILEITMTFPRCSTELSKGDI